MGRSGMYSRVFCILVTVSLASTSAQLPQKPTGYVTDAASVISRDEVRLLDARCASIDQRRIAQVAIVTIDSLQGEPIDKAAHALFRKWGIGRKDVNDGLLLILAIKDRQSRITVGYGLEKVIPDNVVASILKNMRPDLRIGHYASALNLALDLLVSQILSERPL